MTWIAKGSQMRLNINPNGKLVEKKALFIMIEGRVIGSIWADDVVFSNTIIPINGRISLSGTGSI